MKNAKRVAASTGACALAGLMMLGGAQILAYMTDSEVATNTFTIGKVSVDLEEPNFPGNDSDEVKELVPNEPVKKDPRMENTGDNAAVYFMSFDSPMADVVIVNNDGTMTGADGNPVAPADRKASHQEIFGYNYGGAADKLNDADWVQVREVYVDALGNELGLVADDADGTIKNSAAAVRRVFAYNTLVAKDGKTNPLFDEVYLKNVIEGQVDSSIQQITVKGYAIQAAYLKDKDGNNILNFDEDTTNPADITIDAANGTSIFDIYVGQNGSNLIGNEANNNGALDIDGNARDDAEMYLKVSLDIDDTKLGVGETATATAAVDTNYDSSVYTFESSAPAVATVDANSGAIVAVAPGTTTITVTAKAADGAQTVTAQQTVTVDSSLKVAITGDAKLMTAKGEEKALTATATGNPEGTTITTTWKSSNPAVATVDETGKVVAVASGSAEITAVAAMDGANGEKLTAMDSFTVMVQLPPATN